MNSKPYTFPRALKSFVGYLEGTDKSEHTIKNYRLDILSFEQFLQHGLSDKPVRLEKIGPMDLNRFHDHLKIQGLKTNTRRRKLLTVHRFLSYLAKRHKLPMELGKKVLTPHKIERVPLVVSSKALVTSITALPSETLLDERNRVLLWTLAETGCLVSEVSQLRFENWSASRSGVEKPRLHILGKAMRELGVSAELSAAVEKLKLRAGKAAWLFQGFNKFGSLGAAISPRGVELLVKHIGPQLGQGELTPRTFRHSVVIRWFEEGCSREEIQRRLGLRTPYAFRAYEPIFKARSKT